MVTAGGSSQRIPVSSSVGFDGQLIRRFVVWEDRLHLGQSGDG